MTIDPRINVAYWARIRRSEHSEIEPASEFLDAVTSHFSESERPEVLRTIVSEEQRLHDGIERMLYEERRIDPFLASFIMTRCIMRIAGAQYRLEVVEAPGPAGF